MKICVLSRREFEVYQGIEPYIAISITDPNSEPVEFTDNDNFLQMLSLQFHDVDKRIKKRKDCKICKGTGKIELFSNINNGHCYACTDKMDIITFDKQMACKILDFVSDWVLDINQVVVHCEAGISRSAGVASALSLIYNKKDQYYFDNYLPNTLVYRKIINVAVNKGFFSC